MPIVAEDIQIRLTGGAGNTDPNASLGGAISNTALNLAASLHNLFDRVSGQESSAGMTDYRCVAVRNAHATLALEVARAYIQSQVASGATVAIGVEVPVGGVVQTIANETTAPTGVVFSAPASYASGLTLSSQGAAAGTLAANGGWCAIWIQRSVPAGTQAINDDGAVLAVTGDTAA